MIKLLTGDCREVLKTLPDESVHCVVTSPPYWGLRDYGTAQWEGGDAECQHINGRPGSDRADGIVQMVGHRNRDGAGAFAGDCRKCGARRIDSQIGLEPTPEQYVEQMVAVFREVRRVLRKDGTLWINLGDSYATGAGSGRSMGGAMFGKQNDCIDSGNYPANQPNRMPIAGLKPKDLVGIPWRVAFALQADGWYLRQDLIWSKPNPMPESVTDRCTKAHEYIFLLSKGGRYYYDAEAIAEQSIYAGDNRGERTDNRRNTMMNSVSGSTGQTRNKRSVWEVATAPFSEAHFATFPPALIEPCILAGCPEKCCAKCGAPYERQLERSGMVIARSERTHDRGRTRSSGTMLEPPSSKTIGFSPSCSCNAETTSGTVLDPFAGAGTTGLVADRLNRSALLIELNPAYNAMSVNRLRQDAGMFANVAAE